jgi:hypothetical protein
MGNGTIRSNPKILWYPKTGSYTLSGKERYVKIGGEEASEKGENDAHHVSKSDPRE